MTTTRLYAASRQFMPSFSIVMTMFAVVAFIVFSNDIAFAQSEEAAPAEQSSGDRDEATTVEDETVAEEDETPRSRSDRKSRLGVMIAPTPGGSPLVLRVAPGSPADRAGIQHGDFILSIGDKEIDSPKILQQVIASQKTGEAFEMTTWRDGEERSVEITLAPTQRPRQHELEKRAWLGIMIRDSEGPGAEIGRTYVGSPADKAGLLAGDRILKINGHDVSSPRTVSTHLETLDPGDEVKLLIDRHGEQRTMTVTVGNLEDFHERLFGQRFRSRFADFHDMFDPDFDGAPERFFGVDPDDDVSSLLRELMNELREFRKELRRSEAEDGPSAPREH